MEIRVKDDVYMMNEITKNGGKSLCTILAYDTHSGQPTQYGELHKAKMNINDKLMISGSKFNHKKVKKILN